VTQDTDPVNSVLVFDATCLSHFARAERLDVLRDLLVDKECWTTRVVLEEVRHGVTAHPSLKKCSRLTGSRSRNWTPSTKSAISHGGRAA